MTIELTSSEWSELLQLVKDFNYHWGDDSYARHLAEYIRVLFVLKGYLEEDQQ